MARGGQTHARGPAKHGRRRRTATPGRAPARPASPFRPPRPRPGGSPPARPPWPRSPFLSLSLLNSLSLSPLSLSLPLSLLLTAAGGQSRRRRGFLAAGQLRWPATASSSGTLLPLLLLLYGVWVKPKPLTSNWVKEKPNNPFGFNCNPKPICLLTQ